MKTIFAILRIFFILFVWTFGYVIWFQHMMVSIWKFNPMSPEHWTYIWRLWQNGWVIQSLREWMFVISIFAVLPVWLTGWAILCTVPWMKWFKIILLFPFKWLCSKWNERRKAKNAARPKVTKKKSYKQTRPPAVRAATGRVKPPEKQPDAEKEKPKDAEPHNHEHKHAPAPEKRHAESASASVSAPAKNAAPTSSGGSVMDILRSAGYRLISDAKIAGKKIDFVAVAANHILLCLIDSESGDWLADEERFNDEEPLWFSESNHRISPVRVVLNARDALADILTGEARGMEIKSMVVIRQGTIINAEDMFEVWSGLKVTVCRYEDGGPNEIASLQDSVSHVSSPDDGLYHSVSGVVG